MKGMDEMWRIFVAGCGVKKMGFLNPEYRMHLFRGRGEWVVQSQEGAKISLLL